MYLFQMRGYAAVEVDAVAAEAGVTVGALYHHFGSKQGFYGVLRDEMVQRVLGRMEAAAEVTRSKHRLRVALLAAYDGMLRVKTGKLLAEPDPRGEADVIAAYFRHLVDEVPRAEAPLQRYETVLLTAIHRQLPGVVPQVETQTEDFAQYRLVPGEPLYRHRLLSVVPAAQTQTLALLLAGAARSGALAAWSSEPSLPTSRTYRLTTVALSRA